jgi:hypothetical protein
MNPNLLRYAEEHFMEEEELHELPDTVEDDRLHTKWDTPIERTAALTCLKFNRGSEGGTWNKQIQTCKLIIQIQ